MAREYYVPSFATIETDAALMAADALGRLAKIETDPQRRQQFEKASEALFALSSDTDCIVTDPDLFEDE